MTVPARRQHYLFAKVPRIGYNGVAGQPMNPWLAPPLILAHKGLFEKELVQCSGEEPR
jgi:hypothetical protein